MKTTKTTLTTILALILSVCLLGSLRAEENYDSNFWHADNHFDELYVDGYQLRIFNGIGQNYPNEYCLLLGTSAVLTADRLVSFNGDFNFVFNQNLSTTSNVGFAKIKGVGAAETGDIKHSMRTTCTGWVLADGRTIGDASSGAANRADADCKDLFILLWTNLANNEAPVVGGRGSSALNDWNAHKKITLPDLRGRVVAGKDNMGGTSAGRISQTMSGTTLGAFGGSETATIDYNVVPQLIYDYVSSDNASIQVAVGYDTSSYGNIGVLQSTIIVNAFLSL